MEGKEKALLLYPQSRVNATKVKMLKMQWVFKRAEFDEVKQQAEFLKAA
ncbi:MAG: hypothetical protein ACRDCN_04200 [Tannerellaceae bacterium]